MAALGSIIERACRWGLPFGLLTWLLAEWISSGRTPGDMDGI
jgi:hypothetical protein